MKKSNTLIGLSFLGLFSATASANPVSSITEISEEWRANFNAGSKDTLMELYSDEAVLFQPNNEIIDGPENITDFLNGLDYQNVKEFIIWDVEVDATGDMAYETELWQATGVDANGQPVSYDLTVTNILERQEDGSWKIKMQSFN